MGFKSGFSLVSLAGLWNWGLSAKIPFLGFFQGQKPSVPHEDPDDHPEPAHLAPKLGFECKKPHFGVLLGAEGPATPQRS